MTEETAVEPTVVIIGPSDKLDGFIAGFWAKHVSGFNNQNHCLACLLGPREKRIGREMEIGKVLTLNERRVRMNPYFYICGVTSRWQNNFHLAVEWASGETAREVTYNGFEVTVTDARQLEIPPLPDGFAGLPKGFTTCRNFQFAVDRFGLPDDYVPPKPKPKKKRSIPSGGNRMASGTHDLTPGEREMRLAHHVKKEGDVYLVPSLSARDTLEVTFHEKGRYSCTCIHGRHRPYSAHCYHVKAALAYEKGLIIKPLFELPD